MMDVLRQEVLKEVRDDPRIDLNDMQQKAEKEVVGRKLHIPPSKSLSPPLGFMNSKVDGASLKKGGPSFLDRL